MLGFAVTPDQCANPELNTVNIIASANTTLARIFS
jgi:hypothetical protein